MKIINVLICLIILTSQCVCVHSKVININSSNGNDSTECCVNGTCACSSLYTALLNITNNTIINILSKSVALHNTTTMGSGNLTNITITGSNVTIMCNNSGSVYCGSCDHVRIEGITWDSCGDPNGTNFAGVTFNGTSNVSLINCTFQYSLITSVYLLEVSDDIFIQYCNFLSNVPMYFGTLSIIRTSARFSNNSNITVKILKSYFYNNGYHQNVTDHTLVSSLNVDINGVVNCNVTMEKTTFLYNENAVGLSINVWSLASIQLIEILVVNNSGVSGNNAAGIDFESNSNDVVFSILSSNFNGNYGGDLYYDASAKKISITINDSNFTDKPEVHSAIMTISCEVKTTSEIKFYKVQFDNNIIQVPKFGIIDGIFGAVTIVTNGDVEINMHMVKFTSNKYLAHSALCILLESNNNNDSKISVKECEFVSNISPGNGVVLHIYTLFFEDVYVQIEDTSFDQNIAGNSVVYIITQEEYGNIQVYLNDSAFTNNIASSMYLSKCDLILSGTILFKNNTAENGAAMYLDQGTTVAIDDGATVQFIANKATLNGGAIYVDLRCDVFKDDGNTFLYTLSNYNMFINNSAVIAGNSLYFNIPHFCLVNTNIGDHDSILHIPCQFNYSQPVNGKMMQHIPCDLNYTLLNGTGAPIVTSPHELRLYFPYNEGYNISSPSKHNTYFVRNNILGYQVKFTGAVFDYFGKLANPTQFSVQLQYSEHSAYSLISTDHDRVLTESIDNTTDLTVSFKGKRIDTAYINLTLTLTSLSYSLNKINATLVVELIPCVEHPGYTYSEDSQTCVCYHANVKCSNDGNEIKRGYWFGRVTDKATTSLCPHYCKFMDHKQTSEGYFELPNTINAQCNHHRVGRACGECSSRYTLSYDSTDCISIDQCGPGWTVLVVVLTCLYWVLIVIGVFGLMYFKFQISLGYLYGIIYYYSMVGVLLGNNPYILDGTFQFLSILSSFAQLTPRFLGKLCFVKGLSGIDQLFIHYSHAVAVSLLLLLIVVAARCSARMAFYVSRCIIRVICLLILLSYTSIASTSLQLLRPLGFTDVKEWYTYSSPSIQYFHGRHAVYGVVAIVCELVVGIGLPLLLLLEPILSRKINFIRIKPLLDQFQGCYKDKYRWFAAYYLICRQVIFLIVYNFNSNYYNMLFYLQTACVIIAMIHMWFQPYQRMFLNALDGVMLLLILFEVNINTFPFLKNVTIEIVVIMVILPLLLISTVAIKNVSHVCLRRYRYRHYDPINDDDKVANMVVRYVATMYINYCKIMSSCRNVNQINELDEPPDHQADNSFQEPLLNFPLNNDN